ncbi:Uncharacterised protein [Mycobacterium tuberculosis]|nr:Uncharacterised protein [Mycobacterium tuberculosis]
MYIPLLAIELASHTCQIQCILPLFQGEGSGDRPAISSLLGRERIEHAHTFTIFELVKIGRHMSKTAGFLSTPSVLVNKLSSGHGKNVAILLRSIVNVPLPASISVNVQ